MMDAGILCRGTAQSRRGKKRSGGARLPEGIGHVRDHLAQLQPVEPSLRQTCLTVHQTEDVAGDAAGAVAVAAVVDREQHAVREIFSLESAEQADGQGLLTRPALAELLHMLGGGA